jgi:hypothetical protein
VCVCVCVLLRMEFENKTRFGVRTSVVEEFVC